MVFAAAVCKPCCYCVLNANEHRTHLFHPLNPHRKMNSFKTIIYYDWLQLKRSASFRMITVLLSVIAIYALYYGNAQVKEQQQKISFLQHAIDSSNLSFYHTLLTKDTTALLAAQQTGMLYVNYPEPLAALSFGQRDINKFALNLATFSFFYDKYSTGYSNKTLSTEIVNPMKLLAGNLDLSFVLVFLFPLYFILVAYNILSSEKEKGTSSLLSVQGGGLRNITATRLLFRWILITLLSAVFIIAGGILAHSSVTSLMLFLFVNIAYTACWAGIIFLLCCHFNSARNALVLIIAWLLICFVLPGLYNAVLNSRHPIYAKTALSASIQKAENEAYPMPNKMKLDSFLTIFPRYRAGNTDSLRGGWGDARWMSCMYAIMDYYTEPFENEHQQVWSRRIQAANKWNYGSPALLTQYIFNQLSASNAEQMQRFDTLAYKGFQLRRDYFNDLFFIRNNKFTKADFNCLPKQYEYKPEVNYIEVVMPCIFLIFLSILCWFTADRRLKNFKQA